MKTFLASISALVVWNFPGAAAAGDISTPKGDTLRLVFAKTLTGFDQADGVARLDARWIDSIWSSLHSGLVARLSSNRVVSSTVVLRSDEDSALPVPFDRIGRNPSLVLAYSPLDTLLWGVWSAMDSSWKSRGCLRLDPLRRPADLGDEMASSIAGSIVPPSSSIQTNNPPTAVERRLDHDEPGRRPSVWNAPVSPPEVRPKVNKPWFADGVKGLLDFRFDRGWVSGTSSEVAEYSPFSDKSVTSFLLGGGIGIESGGVGVVMNGVWGSQGFGYGSESTRKALLLSIFKTVEWDPPVVPVLFDQPRSSSIRSVFDLEIAAGAIWFDRISDWTSDGKFAGDRKLSGWFWRPSLGMGLDGPEAFSRVGVGLEFSSMSTPDGNRHWKDMSFLVWCAFDVKFTRRKRHSTKS